jgi:GDPmannose 4,6-dehydratase
MRALITGITGQDGSFLAEHLLNQGYEVFGLVRRSSTNNLVRIDHIFDRLTLLHGNLRDFDSLEKTIRESKPDEIYNLAAQSDVGVSFQCPTETKEINYLGLGRIVRLAYEIKPEIKIYQASTSEMFGNVDREPQTEETPMNPVSPYGVAKLSAHQDFVLNYRNQHNMFILSGILFNHESERRGERFVTRKITKSLSRIKLGLQDELLLGNLDAKRDWGYAKDYVEGMWKMLQQPTPEDYILATGQSTTVKEFARLAGERLDMDIYFEGEGINEKGIDNKTGKKVIAVDPQFFRPNELHSLRGSPLKAKQKLDWSPKTSLSGLVEIMVEHDLKDLTK